MIEAVNVLVMPKKKKSLTDLFLEPNPKNTCRIPLTPEECIQPPPKPPQMYEITWRIFRIMAEFVEGFQFLSEFTNEVTVFGSARFKSNHRWYKVAREFGQLCATHGFTIITGGGPGIMEAANRGAAEKGGESIGLNIQLPMEQRINKYVTRGRGFHYFFTRKVMLAASAQAYVYFPGGFGTMDELFEMVTLIQTGKMQHIPIVLVGHDFWDPLLAWIEETMRDREKTVSPKDMKIFQVVDTAEEALDLIKNSTERTFF